MDVCACPPGRVFASWLCRRQSERRPQAAFCVERRPQAAFCVEQRPQAAFCVERRPQAALQVERRPQAALRVEQRPQAALFCVPFTFASLGHQNKPG
jgi:hypothetical protein